MARLIQLPSGTFIAPGAIQMIEARSLARPYVDQGGQEWPAMVFIETRNQVVRVPCTTFVAAENLRDAIGDLVNANHAQAQERRARERGSNGGSSLPGQMMSPRVTETVRGAFSDPPHALAEAS